MEGKPGWLRISPKNQSKKVYIVGGVIIAALLVLCCTLAAFLIKANNVNELQDQNNIDLTEENETFKEDLDKLNED